MLVANTWAAAGYSLSVGITATDRTCRPIPRWVADDGEVGRRVVAKVADRAGPLVWWHVAEALAWSLVAARPSRRNALSSLAAATLALDALEHVAIELPPATVPASPWPFHDVRSAELVQTLAEPLVEALNSTAWTCPVRLANAVDDLRIALRIHARSQAELADLHDALRIASGW